MDRGSGGGRGLVRCRGWLHDEQFDFGVVIVLVELRDAIESGIVDRGQGDIEIVILDDATDRAAGQHDVRFFGTLADHDGIR